MAGGPLLKVTEGSALTRALGAAICAAALLLVAQWGTVALDAAQANARAATAAIAAADGLAIALAQGNDQSEALRRGASATGAHAAYAVIEGGVDEFGISRGTELVASPGRAPSDEQRARLMDHARALTTAATNAAKDGAAVSAASTLRTMDGGLTAAAVAFRPEKSARSPAGVAVVTATAAIPGPFAQWAWAGVLLAVLLVIALGRLSVIPHWLTGVAALTPVLALAFAAAPGALSLDPQLASALGGHADSAAAGLVFAHAQSAITAPLAAAGGWLWIGLAILAVLLGALVEPLAWVLRSMRADPAPYLYVGPAVLATGVLVFVPFAVGVGLAFADRDGSFVAMSNYIEVIESIADEAAATHFWRTLGHTVLWTVSNVTLHVTIGLALAIVLNQSKLRGRAIYRLLLIVPWAVPNYITALTWKWLFNTQYGPINAMLGAIGVGQVDWLGQGAVTNFLANLATNVWLGFPFMMVISLGALQSIPADLYEAASIDGASPWQKFRHITLPLLRPALFPAVILGTIWTFNAFNVIYLVSGGGPDHKTEILITEAYYLFTVLRRIGLAAAYSVLIFVLLLAYTLITNRLTSATEAVDR